MFFTLCMYIGRENRLKNIANTYKKHDAEIMQENHKNAYT